jgi:hypothetical protein
MRTRRAILHETTNNDFLEETGAKCLATSSISPMQSESTGGRTFEQLVCQALLVRADLSHTTRHVVSLLSVSLVLAVIVSLSRSRSPIALLEY